MIGNKLENNKLQLKPGTNSSKQYRVKNEQFQLQLWQGMTFKYLNYLDQCLNFIIFFQINTNTS